MFFPQIPEMCVKPKIMKMYCMFTHVSLHLLNYRMLWCVKTHYDCMLNSVFFVLDWMKPEWLILKTKKGNIPQHLSVLWILLISRFCNLLETVIEVYRLSYMYSFRLKDNQTVLSLFSDPFWLNMHIFLKYCIL